jgi:hypothetical protein
VEEEEATQQVSERFFDVVADKVDKCFDSSFARHSLCLSLLK